MRVEGRSAWIITDGKAGVETQCLAVADALGLAYEIKRVPSLAGWSALAPFGPVPPAVRFGSPESLFAPPWPEIAIAGGRQCVAYMRALRRAAGRSTYTVFLQDPRRGADTADLIWVPEHDRRRGGNVFTTLTTPHRMTLARLEALRSQGSNAVGDCPLPRVVVLAGGDSRTHRFTDADIARLSRSLESLAPLVGSFLITPSRRTPPALKTALQGIAGRFAGRYWDGGGENPLAQFMAHGDMFVVTSDSANMVCEVCVTGRPGYMFHPSARRASKFDRLHEALRQYGALRDLPERFTALEDWSYKPLSATEAIAEEITKRWTAVRAG